jgi:uncharacterized membrane protein
MVVERTATRKRSILKALTYRMIIVCLDFIALYIFTHKIEVAVGFMIVSNVYTTVGYFVHERVWSRITWGITSTSTAALVLMALGCARPSQPPPSQPAPLVHRFEHAEHWTKEFDDPARDAWQKPAEVVAAMHITA